MKPASCTRFPGSLAPGTREISNLQIQTKNQNKKNKIYGKSNNKAVSRD
jgi:hypothetical protein